MLEAYASVLALLKVCGGRIIKREVFFYTILNHFERTMILDYNTVIYTRN